MSKIGNRKNKSRGESASGIPAVDSPDVDGLRESTASPPWKLERRSAFSIFGLFALALTTSLLSTLSPFSRMLPWIDSAAFLSIGHWMHEGLFPYRDIFDHKGLFLHAINFAGMFGGRTGVWLFEVFFLFATAAFSYKTARIWLGRVAAFLATLVLYSFLHDFFTNGNMPEEYAMAFLSASLFVYARFFDGLGPVLSCPATARAGGARPAAGDWPHASAANGEPPGRWQSLVLGACLGSALFLKINFLSLWLAFSILLFIRAARKGAWCFFIRHMIWLAAGAGLVVVPALGLIAGKQAFLAWAEQVIFFNAQYSNEADGLRFLKNIVLAFKKNPLASAALVIHLLLARRHWKSEAVYFHAALAFSILLTVVLFSRTPFLGNHYHMTLFPLSLPAFALCAKRLLQTRLRLPVFTGGLAAVSCAIFAGQGMCFYEAISKNFSPHDDGTNAPGRGRAYTSYTREKLEKVRAATPRGAGSVIVIGNNCNLYFCADALPASSYVYQWPVGRISKKIGDQFQRDICEGLPELLFLAWPYVRVTPTLEVDSASLFGDFPRLRALLENDYERIHAESGLAVLYRRKRLVP
ncbi:MAG: hypothetical protein LBG65_04995 [Puniceicoccales bacterium]|jgi:hypothetical protein|nr:hypothetical protein [Puniceicoccales bacterium]